MEPNDVMTVLYRPVNSSRVREIKRSGILSLCMAKRSMFVSILSNALEMSCCKIKRGLLWAEASRKSISMRAIGGSHDPPGKPAKFPPWRTEFSERIFESLLYIRRVMSFLAVSNKVIGRVLDK